MENETKKRRHYKKVPVNIDEVEIDERLSREAKIKSYLKQVKNPYLVKIDGVIVEQAYSENGYSLQEAVETAIGIDR